MLLVERHIIKKSTLLYTELDKMCFLSKNLYNQALYRIRQHYFNTKEYLNYYLNVKQLTKEKQIKRGLFKSYNGRLINADLNGALNILKKEIPNVFNEYGIEACSTPIDLSIK